MPGSTAVGCPVETAVSHPSCGGCTCGSARRRWPCSALSQLMLFQGRNNLQGSKIKMSKDEFAAPVTCPAKGQGDVGGQSLCMC